MAVLCSLGSLKLWVGAGLYVAQTGRRHESEKHTDQRAGHYTDTPLCSSSGTVEATKLLHPQQQPQAA